MIQDDEDDERLQEISGITESLEEDYLTTQGVSKLIQVSKLIR